MKLIDEKTGRLLKVGDTVTTFRGEPGILTGFRVPHKESSSGRVFVTLGPDEVDREFFPTVIGARFVD